MIEQLIKEQGLIKLLLAILRHTSARRVVHALSEALKIRAGEIVEINNVSRLEWRTCREAARGLAVVHDQLPMIGDDK